MNNSSRWPRLFRAAWLLPVWLLAKPVAAPAQFTFTTNNGAITITKYNGPGGDVVIPGSTNGFPVTSIGSYAFYYCTSLTNVTIGNSVTSIGFETFYYCTGLACITIPNSVTNIGGYAFGECFSLTNVTIGRSVSSIGDGAFSSCTSLTSIMVDTNNPSYCSVAGVVFNKSQTMLIACCPGGLSGGYEISNSVNSIGDNAFEYCTNLTSVTIPNSVTNIGEAAFHYCTSLTNVTIGNSVNTIGYVAFDHCNSLKSITIPKSVTRIGDYALNGYNLTSVYFEGNAPLFSSYISGNSVIVYYLPGTTGWSSTFGGRPARFWALPYPVILYNHPSFGLLSNRFGFTISWANLGSVVVEASTNLANPEWQPIRTNHFLGTNYFSDSQWTNYPARFYRTRRSP